MIDWFDRGGTIDLSDTMSADDLLAAVDAIDGLPGVVTVVGISAREHAPLRAAGTDFVLEGLCALKKISRTEEGWLAAAPERAPRERARERTIDQLMEDEETPKGAKKKYYN